MRSICVNEPDGEFTISGCNDVGSDVGAKFIYTNEEKRMRERWNFADIIDGVRQRNTPWE